jgi:hypothetical protein
LLQAHTIIDYFGSEGHEEIWEVLNTNADHRTRVIDWLEGMLTSQVSEVIEEMNKKASAPHFAE